MASTVVPVLYDEEALADDLARLPAGADAALAALRKQVTRDGGIPLTRVKRCLGEHQDGTDLDGCFKTYVPWTANKWGLVFSVVAHPDRPFALYAFAYGVRHPTGTTASVYRIAHQRLHA